MPSTCIFCKMVKDRTMVPHWIGESSKAFAFLDINPIRRGHSLVIPKNHAQDLSDVPPDEFVEVMALVRDVAARLRRRLGTTGENLLVASGPGSEQAVFHLHVHVIPRLPDDDLRWNDWWQTKVRPATVADLETLARSIRG